MSEQWRERKGELQRGNKGKRNGMTGKGKERNGKIIVMWRREGKSRQSKGKEERDKG